MRHQIYVAVAVFVFCTVLVAGASAAPGPRPKTAEKSPVAPAFTAAQLEAHPGANWLSVQGGLDNERFSSLTQVKPSNVKKLKLAWHISMHNCPSHNQNCWGEEENAVVYKGMMYLENSKWQVFAIDAATGKLKWEVKPTWLPGFTPGIGGRTPGVSIGNGMVFQGLDDGEIVAYDQQTGNVDWTSTVGNWKKGVFLSMTPAYYDGKLYVGTSGGDKGGISSYFTAFNASTGQPLWTWSEVPPRGTPSGNTWPLSDRTGGNYGGGAIWQNPLIDAKDGLMISGTGNPNPWNSRGPGENLWTDSIVALNLTTGQFVWGYQISHHDEWDSDLPNASMLVPETVDGKSVNAVVAVTKDGQTYVLNAKTGKPLVPIKIQKVPTLKSNNSWPVQPIPQAPNTLPGCIAGNPTSYNGKKHCYDQPLKGGGGRICADKGRWTAKGVKAPDGKPYKVSCYFEPYGQNQYVVTPFESMDWQGSSYSPLTHGFITCGTTNRSFAFEQLPPASQVVDPAGGIGVGIGAVIDAAIDPLNLNDFGNFTSLNLKTVSPKSGGKDNWRQIWLAPCFSGSVSTASGLTFVGHLGKGLAKNGHGYLAAVSTKTGQELWESPPMDAPVGAPPITYSVDGDQYVSVVVGGENHTDPTRPNPKNPSARVRGDSIYTYKLG